MTKILDKNDDFNAIECCEHCDAEIYTDGMLDPFDCPSCGKRITPAWICNCKEEDVSCGSDTCEGEKLY